MTGGVAHDFTNLLTATKGNSELLAEASASPELRRLARMIAGAVQRGAELTRSLLAFGRRQALDSKPVEIDGLVRKMDHHGRLYAGVHLLTKPYSRSELARRLLSTLESTSCEPGK